MQFGRAVNEAVKGMKVQLQHQVLSCVVISQDQIACQMPISKAMAAL
jgi:hypothetical protein